MQDFIKPPSLSLETQAVAPTIEEIRHNRQRIAPWIVTTPVWRCHDDDIQAYLGEQASLFFKLELWQHTGTFKPRGALTTLLSLTKEQLERGVTAVSAGNHAIAVSYAAQKFNTHAKVLMPKTADPFRINQCKHYGAEVILTQDIPSLFTEVENIQRDEGRTFVHPFEGPMVSLGTGTMGLELCEQIDDLDAVVVSIGGGGLISGVASACKQLKKTIQVFGVEPVGAATLSQSWRVGKPVALDKIDTSADSLSAPHALPYSFSLCQQFLEGIALVTDHAIIQAMRWLFEHMKLAVEPAAAAALAGIFGPLKEKLQNKRVAMIVCGTNIGWEKYQAIMTMSST